MKPAQRNRFDVIASVTKQSLAAFVLLLAALAANADAYSDARSELVAAYQAEDFAAMRVAAGKALQARPEYPGALFNLAFSAVLDGDIDVAMTTLNRLVEKRIDFGIEDIEAFADLQSHPAWDDYLEAIEQIREPVGEAEVAAESGQSDFIPEGIAVDADGGIILGSIRRGKLLFDPGENTETEIGPLGHWSVFGMRFDESGGLWFASSHVPQYVGISDLSGYKAGLFRLDGETGKISDRARLPIVEGDQVLGDLVIADAETIYTTDSIDGPVYRYSIPTARFSMLVPGGLFGSPQGLVLNERGDYLYVADYIGGLYRVHLESAAVEKITVPADISDYGIDGLYRHGNCLIAIQNGIRPHRVVALTLSADGRAIEAGEILAMNLPQFDEPTLGTVVGDDFYFVANSHWNRFDAKNELPHDLSGPIVLRVDLAE
jgi:sugar lactone lactonase YvrE